MKICRQCKEAPAAIPSALGLCESCLNLWAGTTMVEIEDQEAPKDRTFERRLTYGAIGIVLLVIAGVEIWVKYL